MNLSLICPELRRFHNRNLQRQAARKWRRGLFEQPIPGYFIESKRWNAISKNNQFVMRTTAIAKEHPHWPLATISAAAIFGAITRNPRLYDFVHFATDSHTSTKKRAILPVRFHYIKDSRCTKVRNRTPKDTRNLQIDTEKSSQIDKYVPITESIGLFNGYLVTSPIQTIFDCLRMLPFEDALIICDNLAKKFSITYAQMLNFTLEKHRCWKSLIVGFKEQFVDSKSENGGESFCRARMIRAGISIPLLQVEIPNPLHALGQRVGASFQNTKIIRPDYVWTVATHGGEFTSIAAELDGKQKYISSDLLQQSFVTSTTDVILREKDRETALNLSGFKVIRFQFEEAFANCGAIMIEKLRLAGVPFVESWQKRKRQRLLAWSLGDKTLHKLQ